jgi:hypothetical protein
VTAAGGKKISFKAGNMLKRKEIKGGRRPIKH